MEWPGIPDRFAVLEELASSGTEVLLRARDQRLGREVWLKLPGPRLSALLRERDVRDQVLREARALARVQHRSIVRLLDLIELPPRSAGGPTATSEGGPILVLEPSPGETLAEVLAREKRLGPREVARLGRELCGALEALHAAGIVHRGIAPGAVVIGADGLPRLASVVFAKEASGASLPGTSLVYREETSPEAHAILPAPEQLLGETADRRSDLFGLGWLLYLALTGEAPYEGLDLSTWRVPRDPLALAPGTPRDLARVLARALAVSPAKRFSGAAEMGAALAGLAEPEAPVPEHEIVRSRPWLVPLAVLAAGALAVLPVWLARTGADDGARASLERGLASGAEPDRESYAERYERSRALLIGIGKAYGLQGFTELPNAERDVRALAERLRELPRDDWRTAWEVTTLTEGQATQQAILSAVRTLGSEAGRDERLFLYYAGHGEGHDVSSDSGWVVPADARPLAEDPSRVSWIRFDEFERVFDETRAKHVLVAMDCCYGGRLTRTRSAGPSAFASVLLANKAHVVISSGRPNERVPDGPEGQHSPFALGFLEALAQPGEITSSMLVGRLQERYRATGASHKPQLGYPEGHPPEGEFVFFVE